MRSNRSNTEDEGEHELTTYCVLAFVPHAVSAQVALNPGYPTNETLYFWSDSHATRPEHLHDGPGLQPVPLFCSWGLHVAWALLPLDSSLVTKLGTEELSDFTEVVWVIRGPAIHTHQDQESQLPTPARMLLCRAHKAPCSQGTVQDGGVGT